MHIFYFCDITNRELENMITSKTGKTWDFTVRNVWLEYSAIPRLNMNNILNRRIPASRLEFSVVQKRKEKKRKEKKEEIKTNVFCYWASVCTYIS